MTRIGFAFNQKPDGPTLLGGGEIAARSGDDKPPSMRRDLESRNIATASASPDARLTPSTDPDLADDDVFAEWDSPTTIDAVADALASCGEVIRLEANADFPRALRDAAPDIVFNIAEGLHGVNREAHVPAICEFYGIPYSGSDPFTLSLCLHKARTKETLAFHGVPTAPFVLAGRSEDLRAIAHGQSSMPQPTPSAPLFIKPVHEGSSKGITERNLIRTAADLLDSGEYLLSNYEQPVLVEGFLPGAEFTCGVLGNGEGASVLPIVAIDFDSLPAGALPIYGYEAKWILDRPEAPLNIFQCPARIPESLGAEIERVVLDAYRIL